MEKDKEHKHHRKIPAVRLAVGGALLLLGGAGWLAARYIPGFADLYGFNVYPAVVNVFARISGVFPFSVAELLVVCGVLSALTAIVYFIVGLIRKKGRRLRFLLSPFSSVLLAGGILLFEYVYGMGINYSRTPFSQIAGLDTGKYTVEELRETLDWAISSLNSAAAGVETDAQGHVILPDDLSSRAAAAMKKLGAEYAQLDSYYPRVKPVVLSELMCYGHITGIFTFYSIEANYNTRNVPEEIGHTLCHELSHMTGFMREDEANFISFLACRGSEDAYLNYSGWYDITIYLLNAYAGAVSGEKYAEAYLQMTDTTIRQFEMQSEFWKKYETHFGEVAEVMNDVYLKINDQSDGTRSYGRVVDLVIADHLKNKMQ